jgi:hypothetical protein
MTDQPRKEFGKRRPQPPAPLEPPPKRSSHVALLLMGTFAVGGAAYALMPRQSCTPSPPGMAGSPGVAAPATPQPNATPCSSRGSWGGSSHSSRYSFFGGGDSAGRSSSGASSSEAESGSASRGGFGALARAFGFSGRG